MDKAILFGMFDFVNFHIGKNLLNKGIEVKGIHVEEKDNIPFLEEKKLEVGRNANFIEQSLVEWESVKEKDTERTNFIISIYDLFMSKKDQILQDRTLTKAIIQFLEDNKNNLNIVVILPIQMLTSTFNGQEMENFVNLIKGIGENTQLFYLPAIYGPWQTSAFLFQKVIVSKYQETNITDEEREWKNDILFINDAIESILDIIESEETGSYLLESGKENHWSECAECLNISEEKAIYNNSKGLLLNSDIVKVTVKRGSSFMESIQEQIQHVERLYANRL
jgi:hypothetical protein